MCLVVVFAMWTAASLAGAGMRMTNSVYALCGAGIASIFAVLGATVGWGSLKGEISSHPMVKMMGEIGTSMIDLIHAMMIFCGGPFFVCFLLLSFLNQLVRKAACLTFSKKLNGDVDAKQTFTSLAHAKLAYMAKWNWGATLRNVNYLAIAGWVVKFGSTLTYMGLRWMIDLMLGADLSCGASSGIFLLVGAIMFLLPPVPGLAVYLCAGVLLTPVCEDSMGGFWGAAIYSSFFAYLIKMIAHVMQQKLIGECCGAKSVGVRAAVAINSELMRTIRYILEQRGISIAKVCIMCGGPDWPTSVLCGILGLNVFQMLLGLSPVFLLTVPTSLAGAFQLKTSEGQMWESAATIMLMVASLTQLVAAVAMMYLIQQTKTHKRDKIQDFPTDEDVARKDKEDEENVRAFAHVTSFAVMSRPATALLLSATASSYVSFYMLYFLECFQPFDLASSLDKVTCMSPIVNETSLEAICDPFIAGWRGWMALALFLYGCLALYLWLKWVGLNARAYIAAGGADAEGGAAGTDSLRRSESGNVEGLRKTFTWVKTKPPPGRPPPMPAVEASGSCRETSTSYA